MALKANLGLQATVAFAVSPSDTNNLSSVTGQSFALYIGTSGDVTVDTAGNNSSVLFSNVPIGFFPVLVTKVWNTGTTASNIVAIG